MAGSYSRDLRSRVPAAVEEGASPEEAARRFAVGRSTAYRRVAAARDEGRREAKPVWSTASNGRSRAAHRRRGRGTGGVEAAMLELAGGPHHPSLAEIAARLAAATGVRVHLTTVHRALRRAGWTWKRLSLRAAEQDREDVAQAGEARWGDPGGVAGIGPERLVFLDGCGVLTDMVRLHGRSPRGTRARAAAPCGRWTRWTVLGALGAEAVVGAMGVEAATGAAVVHAYLDQVSLPEPRRTKPDAVLVMDNLPAHKAPCVGAPLDASGFSHRYLPSYSPDLSPIELIWAKVKAAPRRVAARTAEALHEALGPALGAVTPQDAAGCFRHCGYDRPT